MVKRVNPVSLRELAVVLDDEPSDLGLQRILIIASEAEWRPGTVEEWSSWALRPPGAHWVPWFDSGPLMIP